MTVAATKLKALTTILPVPPELAAHPSAGAATALHGVAHHVHHQDKKSASACRDVVKGKGLGDWERGELGTVQTF